jgi:hypothetical protein
VPPRAYGATGSVVANIVGDDVWSPDTTSQPYNAAAGILVYAAGAVPITGNTVNSAQFGISVSGDGNGDGDGATVSANKIDVTYLFDAIDVCGASNATISGNRLNGTDEVAIHLDSSCVGASTGNMVSGNKINGACVGVLEGVGSAGTITGNTVLNAANVTLSGGDVCPAPGRSARVRDGKRHLTSVRCVKATSDPRYPANIFAGCP